MLICGRYTTAALRPLLQPWAGCTRKRSLPSIVPPVRRPDTGSNTVFAQNLRDSQRLALDMVDIEVREMKTFQKKSSMLPTILPIFGANCCWLHFSFFGSKLQIFEFNSKACCRSIILYSESSPENRSCLLGSDGSQRWSRARLRTEFRGRRTSQGHWGILPSLQQ